MAGDPAGGSPSSEDPPAGIEDPFDRLSEFSADTTSADARAEIKETKALLAEAHERGLIDSDRRHLEADDAVQAFVGSVIFASPLLVEDGVFDVAAYFLSFRLAGFPVFFVANTVFILAMIGVLVYWAGPRDVAVSRPLFGFIPRRLVGISAVSFLTAAALMTMWGRVLWADPVVAVARVSVVWSVASFGAALGDVLPGESSGDDINDDFDQLGDRVGEFID